MNFHTWKCDHCGEEFEAVCYTCSEEILEKAVARLAEERSKKAKRYRLIPIEDDEKGGA